MKSSIEAQAEEMVQAAMPVLNQIAASLRQGTNTGTGYDKLSHSLLAQLPDTVSVHEAFALGFIASIKVDLKLAELVADA